MAHEWVIPPVVRTKAVVAGAGGWVDGLPDLVASLEADWAITVLGVFDTATEAFVADVRCDDGTQAVLKIPIARDGGGVHTELIALRLADGEGCAELLHADEARGAYLVERLGRSLFDLALPIGRRHEILCTVAARVWRPAADCGLPTGAEKGRWLVDEITRLWEKLDHPCSARAIDYALACAQRRIAAHDDERAVLVHGDVHQWNTLKAGDTFKLVDPDGLLADAEYDLGIVMREDPVELLAGDPRERARWLAARTGLDATAIWEWGAVERVSTGLYCVEIGLEPVGTEMLHAAERIGA